jgi:flagellar biosynthesis protein FlhA
MRGENQVAERLQNILHLLIKNTDIVVAFGVIGIILMIILPMPTALLDIFLTLNISASLIILLLTLFATDALQFAVFPSLLLITTLFRLGLNISSTRLILSDGYAGNVISAFGSFVVRDNYVVGAIIFVIIVVIQFVVITNGAGRVAEVAARFTLDAMPGKQMSIDADLNTGAISEQEAKLRRKKLQQEADFYGAMDGASKFVKGDAIAGIVIVLINIIGGIIIGYAGMKMSITEAFSTFAKLTIGDGLVSQIPALLISTASGILITRSASENSFGKELTSQVKAFPKVIAITSVILLLLGLIPQLPNIPFLLLSLATGASAYLLYDEQRKERMKAVARQGAAEAAAAKSEGPEDVTRLIQVEPIEIEIGYGLISLADGKGEKDLLSRVTAIRRQCALDMGIIIQPIRIRDNLQLSTNEYRIKIKGMEVARGEIIPNHLLAMNPEGGEIRIEGIKTTEPTFGLQAVWITPDKKDQAELEGYTVVDPSTVMITHLSEIFKKHGHELLGRQEVKNLLDSVKENYSAVVEELVPDLLTVGEVQKVLQNLLREGVPIRDMVTILESLADHAPKTKDIETLTEYVRYSLSRYIYKPYVINGVISVIMLEPQLEQIIHENLQTSIQGTMPVLSPQITQRVFDQIKRFSEEMAYKGLPPVALCSPTIRQPFKRLVEIAFPGLAVLSINEIPPHIEIQSVGMVKLSDS